MRGVKLTLLVLLGLFAGLLLALAVLLGSTSGSRWLLNQVPGLQVEGFSGRLGGAWQADRLSWQQDGTAVEVERPALAWSPACLLRLTLCIEHLRTEAIDLTLAPADDSTDTTPFSLPQLSLPLALEVGEVQIGALRLAGAEQFTGLDLAAFWRDGALQIQRFQVQRDDLQLRLSGQLQPAGDWPLQLTGEAQLPAPDGQPWQLALNIDGALQTHLRLQADSTGYLNGQLSGSLQALAEHLPAELLLTADGFVPAADLPPTLRLDQLQLIAKGDLDSGYVLAGQASLPGEGGAVALSLQGTVDGQGAKVDALRLASGAEAYVQLAGELDWLEGFAAETRIDWQSFDWQRLYPQDAPPPVTLERLNGEISYADGAYLGNFQAALNGPAGDFSVQSPFSGNLEAVHLPQLQASAGQGRIAGQVSIGFAQGVDWKANLTLSELDPAFWLAELPGRLGGTLRSEGSLRDEQLNLSANLDLQGRLRNQPARLSGSVQGGGTLWNLEGLDLRLGDNRIDGQVRVGERLDGQLRIAMTQLSQLWPGLRGRLNGQLAASGSAQAPQGQLTLQGQDIALDDLRLQRLTLAGRLGARQQGQLDLQVDGLASGETALGQLNVRGEGTAARQRLTLALQGPQLNADLALQGVLEQGAWRGQLAEGRLRSGAQDWQLQQPASIVRLASGQLDLGAHCWAYADARLCAENQRLLPEPRIRYRLSDFPLDSLAAWLPQDLRWQGQLNAEVQLDLPASGPTGRILVDAGQGTWQVRDAQQWLDFSYDSLRLSSQLQAQQIDTSLELRGPRIGELSVQARLDPRPADKPLSGEFRLRGVDLALARPFLPLVEQVGGQLNGTGVLTGTLLKPQVNGEIRLSDGELSGDALPTQVEQLQIQVRIAGEQLQVEGDWRSGEQGRGQVQGALAWAEGLSGELRLNGSRLPVRVEPYADLEVEPDLRLSLAQDRLALAGTVRIPRGSIVVRELPPSTVQVSRDAVIVGQEAPVAENVAINMDVNVEVGQERLSFSGFGLNADLAGRVHIGDDLDTRGELNLNNGRFRAYGQRLTIRRARLLFTGPIDQPFLDIEAIRKVDDVVAGLRLTGSAEQPRSEVFSEPAMSQEQALSYLVLGRPLGQSSEDNNMLAQAALSLGLAGSASVTNTVAQTLGIQDFQLDTEGSGSTTSVVASGNLSERLSLRYGVGVFEPVNTVALRYELTRRIYLEAASGLASSLDIFYRRDF
ncbi:MAG: translocation/assembly module TamB [Gammaproteobacteria bacterium]|nr:translocation/assembly module TamB [Gammaproteobacteria bacterium]MBU1489612.1 translocation/assembly module TamB [Gammaproteobacteria bacterium]MBU2067769.1 translocation/assembly module TamB [Gammaproteobacteria bacterium]MBU2140952.1 translocation/assembly module TamB [Gammaproteobacteria bacterium]MBU2216817.1 translocation/assembly module TamB [Gammaproteobacteria bacterium]